MRRAPLFSILFSLVVATVPADNAFALDAKHEAACIKSATSLVNSIAGEKFAEAVSLFDQAMKDALPAKKLAAVWHALVVANGSYKSTDDPVAPESTGNMPFVIRIPVQFEKSILDASIACVNSGEIGGLYFIPH